MEMREFLGHLRVDMPRERVVLFERALEIWGVQAQTGMLLEEMGEVMVAWNKQTRGVNGGTKDEFFKECVDLSIMVEQMKVCAVLQGFDWDAEQTRKLERLKLLLDREINGGGKRG